MGQTSRQSTGISGYAIWDFGNFFIYTTISWRNKAYSPIGYTEYRNPTTAHCQLTWQANEHLQLTLGILYFWGIRNDVAVIDRMVTDRIKLILDYCQRFYDRQFITRHKENSDILSAFEQNIKAYFEQGEAMRHGLPSVAYFADRVCLSPGYFGDLIRKETGLTAQIYIQQHILALSKQMLLDPARSITQVADQLGFQYPQHFSRFFKKLAGITPKEYKER